MKKHMSAHQFRLQGYLQEVNRQFLHPLGLALGIEYQDENDTEANLVVLDSRDDPEGVIFANGAGSQQKAHDFRQIMRTCDVARGEALGFVIQPIEQLGTP